MLHVRCPGVARIRSSALPPGVVVRTRFGDEHGRDPVATERVLCYAARCLVRTTSVVQDKNKIRWGPRVSPEHHLEQRQISGVGSN